MRKVWERWCVYRNAASEPPPPPSKTNISAGFHVSDMFKCSVLAPLFKPSVKEQRSHRSCSISLFCRFHCSLKSVENSCQTEKKVLSETSFSPAFGLTEKDTVNSEKLRGEKKRRSGARDDHGRDQETCSRLRRCDAELSGFNTNQR